MHALRVQGVGIHLLRLAEHALRSQGVGMHAQGVQGVGIHLLRMRERGARAGGSEEGRKHGGFGESGCALLIERSQRALGARCLG